MFLRIFLKLDVIYFLKKSRNFSVVVLIYLISFSVSFGQGLIALQNGARAQFFTDSRIAFNESQDGDTIYFPAGGFIVPDSINKRLHIIGVGYNSAFSQLGITILVNDLNFYNGSIGSSVNGIYVNGRISFTGPLENICISRCYINGGVWALNSVDRITIKECILGASDVCYFCSNLVSINLGNSTNSYISNNIVLSKVFVSGAIRNNIFLSSAPFFDNFTCYNSTLENNIIRGSYRSYNSFWRNNINGYGNGPDGNGNQGINNFQNIDPVSVFIQPQYFLNGSIHFDADYHLVQNSQFYTGATDGRQIGIYGGTFPWKDGALPANPQVQFSSISSSTDQSGNLKVNIKVSAQDR